MELFKVSSILGVSWFVIIFSSSSMHVLKFHLDLNLVNQHNIQEIDLAGFLTLDFNNNPYSIPSTTA